MTVQMTPFLRNTLRLDALASGAAGLLMAAGSTVLGPLLDLPAALLFWAGLVLLPWTAALVAVSRRPEMPRSWLREIVLINWAWVAASAAMLVGGLVQPNLLGALFVVAMALAVALFAVLQGMALRASRPATA